MTQTGAALLAKKVLDRAIAGGVLVAGGPLLLTAAVAVRITLGTPVFFSQVRPGKNGRPFRIYKLRTMSDARDADGALLPDEQRLTALGRLLRATSIDELPQLVNVMRGELSLVGPRPLLMDYLSLYSAKQARRHDVLPGITGWAQINGRNALTWEEKFALDVWYVDNWSLLLDLRILAQTAVTVLGRRGISSEKHATMEPFCGSSSTCP